VTRLAIALLVVAMACTKAKGPPPNATTTECEQYRTKMFAFLPAEQQEAMAKLGMNKPSPLEMKLCQERMTSEEVRCALAATTQDAALACKPSVDIRPADAKRTPEECAAYQAHALKLATENEAGQAVGPPFTPAMAALFGRECERWLSKKRFDCVMKAPSAMGLMQCPP
jgi:hypothetical protein